MRGATSRKKGGKRSRKTKGEHGPQRAAHSAALDSLEIELRRAAKKRRKNASARRSESPEVPQNHIEWRLSMLEGVLSAEQRARAQPTLSTAETILPIDDGAKGREHKKTENRHVAAEEPARTERTVHEHNKEYLVSFNSMTDRLATEIIRRQSLEERIVQLEDMIRSLLEKTENGAIDIVPSEMETVQPEPIQVQVQQKKVVKDDFTPQKVRSGTPRLDDLLLGGIPFGSNVLVYGPPFTGKELLVDSFIAEGVKWGTPVLWVLTDRSPRDIRNEMKAVFPEYEDAEKLGMIRYIDAYSRAVGNDAVEPFTDYVDSPTDFEAIHRLVERSAKEFKKEHDYYRMAIRGLSTLIAYSDSRSVFKFLNSFVGKRKRDKAVTLFTIAKGVHTDHDIQMISSLMDGVIELKLENHETYMSIKGVCDVRSRAYVRYALSKTGMEIGSFSLDHIR